VLARRGRSKHAPCGINQKPVAVTLQVKPKLIVPVDGKVATVTPPVSKFGHAPAAGHTAPFVGVQLVTAQLLNPVPGVSAISAPSAAAGPALVTVIVYAVDDPDTTVAVLSVFVTERFAAQFAVVETLPVLLTALVSPMAGVVMTAELLLGPGQAVAATATLTVTVTISVAAAAG